MFSLDNLKGPPIWTAVIVAGAVAVLFGFGIGFRGYVQF